MDKREYEAPTVTDFGTVTELTQTGLTHPGADAKQGSKNSQGG